MSDIDITYPFVVRLNEDGTPRLAYVHAPESLTVAEAERLATFVRALPMGSDVEQPETEEAPECLSVVEVPE